MNILSVLPFVGLFFVCVGLFFAPRPGHTAGPITTRDGSYIAYHVFSDKELPFGGLDDEK